MKNSNLLIRIFIIAVMVLAIAEASAQNYTEAQVIAKLKSDHAFCSYIDKATDADAAERMVEFIGTMVALKPAKEQRLMRALCKYIALHPAERSASEWSAHCAMIYSKVEFGDYYMILKGRVVDSVIAKHLSRKELNELHQKYEHYYNSMIVVLRHLEQEYNKYNCAVNPDIVVTAYGFPEIDDIIWYLKQTGRL